MWTAALGVLVALAFVLAPPSFSAGTGRVPQFTVSENEHLLYESGYVGFDAFDLDAAPAAERMTISIPHTYGLVLTDTPGTDLGAAYAGTVTSAGGAQTSYDGKTVVLDQNDVAAQTCTAGVHTAVWALQVHSKSGGSLDIPVAVDWTGTNYELTMCFDAVRALGLEVSEAYLQVNGVFRNPAVHGDYLFDAVVTPFAADGTPNMSIAYELQGYEDLPQLLTATAVYHQATKTLVVTGASHENGRARTAVRVHVLVGRTQDYAAMTEIGFALTGADGRYAFGKKLSVAPKFVAGHVDHYYKVICTGVAAAPAGCVSETWDGRSTYVVPVVVKSR